MAAPAKLVARKIPRSGEALPVIGLGTWQTGVGKLPDAAQRRKMIEWLHLG